MIDQNYNIVWFLIKIVVTSVIIVLFCSDELSLFLMAKFFSSTNTYQQNSTNLLRNSQLGHFYYRYSSYRFTRFFK